MSIVIAIILALAIGGGVSVAAENARPGNALYGFKVGVNEGIRAALNGSGEADAHYEARRAERRLEEAEQMAAKGEFNADARASIEANFVAHADRVNARIDEFEAKSDFKAAADVAANFETSLEAHERILAALAARAEGSARAEVNALKAKVSAEADEAEEDRANAETKVSGEAQANVEAAARGRLGAAENKIAEVRAFIDNVSARISAEAKADAEAKLAAANQAVVDGKAKLDAGAFGEAFVMFGGAHEMAQEAKLLLEVNQSLDLNLDLGRSGTAPNVSATGSERSEGRVEIRL